LRLKVQDGVVTSDEGLILNHMGRDHAKDHVARNNARKQSEKAKLPITAHSCKSKPHPMRARIPMRQNDPL
jgi:hypothetical protein